MKKLIAIVLLLGLLTGCAAQTPAPVAEVETTQPVTTQPVVETIQEEEKSPLHSGLNSDGSFDEFTLFIGDSLTYGMVTGYLPDNGYLGGAKYMAIPGGAITCYMKGPRLGEKPSAYTQEFEGLTMRQAVEQYGKPIRAVYLMLGTNATEYDSDAMYAEMVDHLLTYCPDATIYLELVPRDRSVKVSSEKANQRINRVFQQFQDEPRVQLIDTNTAIGDHLAADGIHLQEKGQACWYKAIVDYAAEKGIER